MKIDSSMVFLKEFNNTFKFLLPILVFLNK